MPRLERPDAEIHYEPYGSGPALLFAHGAGGNTMSWWQQVPHFAERYTVITIDHRGFGRSTCAPDSFHPSHFAGDALAVLDACRVERAAFVCQSMGGWTGLRTAVESPERVAALVLCGTPGGLVTDQVVKAAASIGSRIDAEEIRGNAALAPDYPARRPDMAFLYDRIAEHNGALDPALLARLFEKSARTEPDELKGFAVPTLVISGDRDLLFPPEALREVAAVIPGAELRELPGIGHSTYFEDPARFNELVEAFLAEHHPAA